MFEAEKKKYYRYYKNGTKRFYEIPKMYLTKELCMLHILKGNGTPIEVPKKYRTLELCIAYGRKLYTLGSTLADCLIKINVPEQYVEQVLALKTKYYKIEDKNRDKTEIVAEKQKNLKDSIKKVYSSVVCLETKNKGIGSGFLYKVQDEFAYILTNYHVVKKGYEFNTTIYNGEELISKLVGYDTKSDIAVLRTSASKVSNLIDIGDSNNVETGEAVFVIGSPYHRQYLGTVTKGIISCKNRELKEGKGLIKMFQIDSAVNPGNSGGPLCNANGQVIGIINSKVVGVGVEGIGFAIPINIAMESADKIEKNEFENKERLKVKVITKKGPYKNLR